MPAAKKRALVGPKASSEIDRVVGKTIRRLRVEAGMSQSALGAAAGVSFQQVQKYENALNRLSVARLAQFAEALDIPVIALLNGLPNITKRERQRTG
jgi:transcriptional regulator with XRE-family HTH domain